MARATGYFLFTQLPLHLHNDFGCLLQLHVFSRPQRFVGRINFNVGRYPCSFKRSAAAVGAIAGAAYILARRSLADGPTVLIAVVTFVILTWTRRIPEPLLLVAAGVIGIFLSDLG